MKRIFFYILILTVILEAVFAGGQKEPSREEAPHLEEAVANPVDDISGYPIRISGWWDGPNQKNLFGRAALKKWKAVEEEFDVTINWVQLPNPYITVEKLVATVLTGEPMADIVNLNCVDAIPSLVEGNMILALDDYFDFSDPKWPSQLSKIAMYKGKTYGYISNFMTAHGIWYNRTLFEREGFPDLYELQENGEWTWDAYLDLAKRATRDTDGDGEVDQFGIALGYEIEYPLIYSNGGEVVSDNGDSYDFVLNSEEALESLEFIQAVYSANVFSRDGETSFISGKAAMYGGEIFQGWNMANNMNDDYGFVFYPKGPKAEDYVSVSNSMIISVFPANVNYPPDRLAGIVESITLFEMQEQIVMEYLQDRLETIEDIETALEMMDKTEFNRTAAFPGLNSVIGRIFRNIRKGTSPATAVEEYRLVAQQAISAVVRSEPE